MTTMIQRLRALAPYLTHPKLWHWSRRGVAITVSLAAIASYLLISRAWIWHVAAKRRGVRP